MDREHNEKHYPVLSYPEIYVLDGGYQRFFREFEVRRAQAPAACGQCAADQQRDAVQALCMPRAYIPMDHQRFVEQARQFTGELRRARIRNRLHSA
jgi:hypothetical protein